MSPAATAGSTGCTANATSPTRRVRRDQAAGERVIEVMTSVSLGKNWEERKPKVGSRKSEASCAAAQSSPRVERPQVATLASGSAEIPMHGDPPNCFRDTRQLAQDSAL